MSWSFNAIGRAPAVLEAARKHLGQIKCSEPEESIKNSALGIIETSLAAMPDSSAVKIEAYGSHVPGKFYNSMMLKIEPLFGFVE